MFIGSGGGIDKNNIRRFIKRTGKMPCNAVIPLRLRYGIAQALCEQLTDTLHRMLLIINIKFVIVEQGRKRFAGAFTIIAVFCTFCQTGGE